MFHNHIAQLAILLFYIFTLGILFPFFAMTFVLVYEIFILYFVRIACSLYTDRCKSSSLFATKIWSCAKIRVCNNVRLHVHTHTCRHEVCDDLDHAVTLTARVFIPENKNGMSWNTKALTRVLEPFGLFSRILRRIFGSMRDEKLEWRRLHNEEFSQDDYI